MVTVKRFSQEVLAKGRSGKIEVRALESRGFFVICKYLDPETMRLADSKRKLSMKSDDGSVREFFIIPMKGGKRSLLIEAEVKEKERKVWNEKKGCEEELWL